MSNFKVGDKVRCINRWWKIDEKHMFGEIYTVAQSNYDIGEDCIILVEDTPDQLYAVGGFEIVEEESMSKLIDNQEHYKANGIEPIEIMKANMSLEQYYGFLYGNLQKYISRHEKKNKVEDLQKAMTYLTWMIEEWENGNKK